MDCELQGGTCGPKSSANKVTLTPEREKDDAGSQDSGLDRERVFEIYLEEECGEMEAKLELRFSLEVIGALCGRFGWADTETTEAEITTEKSLAL